ncbi:Stk1 family PASTA domain-containing Ser/Thr kinase [Nocardioides sp. 1609]|uniref:Stk1 family PASTA domain-containing Ser/Thr kinase n=1 Tax=Nocardioides sp. 1609 TaxID=2508327 RepID=UPI001FD64B44|nr:Stk1 family PASTA domain-containing Ser/Thr kinase [Nocardioides sp. 1609]
MATDANGAGTPSAGPRGRLLDGRYLVGPRIARGGMASVHEAHDVRLDRTVAVKIMHAGLSDADSDRDFADRFVREARAAARLSHPNVVAVYDQGDDDGTVFLAMELVSGHTLRDTIAKESPMPPARALALIEPVLSALAAAHRAGLIHRDVKPENVLISDEQSGGQVKVADFGLAKAISADTQHTATQGVLIGTVSYLAPELVVEGRADARADVYAAGVMLYELLTGEKPHEGETPIAVAYKHVHHDVPPPSALVPGIPPYVDALVARATARDRALRPADAGVLLHQVHRVSHALDRGVRDDPELTLDLAPHLLTPERDDLDTDVALFADQRLPRDHHEPTTTLPVLDAPATRPVPLPPRTDQRPDPRTGQRPGQQSRQAQPPGPPPRQRPGQAPRQAGPPGSGPTGRPRRSRRGPVLLVLALVLALAVGGGAFWYGWARYTAAPTVVGESRAVAIAAVEDAELEIAFAEPVYDSDVPEGDVVSADPAGGAQVLPGDTVTVTLSLGKLIVPGVRNLTEDAAQDELMAVQLEIGESIGRYSETVGADSVLGTVPKAGAELSSGDTVQIVVSLGRRPIKVGSWVGRTLEEAVAALDRRNLDHQSTEVFDAEVPRGTIISQDPAGGTLFRDDVVSLVVSKGPEMVEVPRVNLFGVEAAEQALRDAGLVPQRSEEDDYYGLGFVVRTDPAAGTSVPKGSTVTIYVV